MQPLDIIDRANSEAAFGGKGKAVGKQFGVEGGHQGDLILRGKKEGEGFK